MANHATCPYCKASLDFAEMCDCGGEPRVKEPEEVIEEPRSRLTPAEIRKILYGNLQRA